MRRLAVLTVTLVALVAAGSGQAASGPISNVSYSPKPVYDDQITMVISFTTTRKARPGYEWGVILNIFGKRESSFSCSWLQSSWDPALSGSPVHPKGKGKVSILLVGKRLDGYPDSPYWCRGSASVRVVEHKLHSPGLGKWYGEESSLDFRVLGAP